MRQQKQSEDAVQKEAEHVKLLKRLGLSLWNVD